MFVIIGLVVVFGSVIAGYTMHHGHLGVLMQVSESMGRNQHQAAR